MTSITKIAMIAMLPAIACSVPASAHPAWLKLFEPTQDGVHSARVDIGDIDIATRQGQKQLKSRVSRAARTICYNANFGASLFSSPTGPYFTCMHETVDAARPALDKAIARARAGQPVASIRFGIQQAAL